MVTDGNGCYDQFFSSVPKRNSTERFLRGNIFGIEDKLFHGKEPAMRVFYLLCLILGGCEAFFHPATGAEILQNETLQMTFFSENGRIEILDRRTGKIWKSEPGKLPQIKIDQAEKSEEKICFHFTYPGISGKFSGQITLENESEIVLSLSGSPETVMNSTRLEYPYPLTSSPGERLVFPHAEGFAFPVELADIGLPELLPTYNRNGLCMRFWGQHAERRGEDGRILPGYGYMAILRDSENACVRHVLHENGLRTAHVGWTQDKKKWGYDRALRWVFFETCDHVTMAKRYLSVVKELGFYVPFSEKESRNPQLKEGLDRLIGAANIWYWGAEKVAVAKELKELGVERFLMNSAGGAEAFQGFRSDATEVRELAAIPYVLTSCYDIYKDLIEPQRLHELRYVSSDWIPEAWEKDDIVRNADGSPSRGWGVFPKDPSQPMIHCASLCEARATEYARKRIGKILETMPYHARFLDVTGVGLGECWNPKHPLNRRESRTARQALFAMLRNELNLVVGTEDGLEYFVPVCDYLEGMMSGVHYRVPDAGRWMWKVWDEVPRVIETFQVNEQYRIPLWELVFHDCVVSYWYWGDYNNKLPKVWHKRDLFNALYGTPPMYLFDREGWDRDKHRIAASYQLAEPVSRLSGRFPMVSHMYLTVDRKVQQTQFANGLRVTVNFGKNPFTGADGFVLEPEECRIEWD